jgi:hypothetical protein
VLEHLSRDLLALAARAQRESVLQVLHGETPMPGVEGVKRAPEQGSAGEDRAHRQQTHAPHDSRHGGILHAVAQFRALVSQE